MWTKETLITEMAKALKKAAIFASEGEGTNQAGAWDTLAKEALDFLKNDPDRPDLTDEEWCQVKDALRDQSNDHLAAGDSESADALNRIVGRIAEQQRQ
jgi:hypothetical protein